MSTDGEQVVIIGAGMGASHLIHALRHQGWTGGVTLVGEEPWLPYHRPPLSKTGLLAEPDAPPQWIKASSFYTDHQVRLLLGVRALAIEASQKTVQLDNGESLAYDALVLATGSVHRPPPLSGLDKAGLYVLRNQDDAQALRAAAARASRALILGGGYIGLEVAATLRKGGLDVTVLEMAPRVLSRVTSPVISSFFERLHREEGVRLLTGMTVTEILGDTQVTGVRTRDGDFFEADLIVLGTGGKAHTVLAETAGLPLRDGIVVDGQNRTSDPSIFAIGDCAAFHHALYDRWVRLESVQNAVDQAKTVAAVLTGRVPPPVSVPWFWSDQYDVKLQIVGLSEGYTEVVLRGDPDVGRQFSAWYFREDDLLAVDAINDAKSYVVAGKLIAAHAKPDKQIIADPQADLKQLIIKP